MWRERRKPQQMFGATKECPQKGCHSSYIEIIEVDR
jgi:hypothetical protein